MSLRTRLFLFLPNQDVPPWLPRPLTLASPGSLLEQQHLSLPDLPNQNQNLPDCAGDMYAH